MAFHPKTAAFACFRRSRRFLKLAENDLPDSKIKNDLRRSAIVMSVAALDSYMHWLVFRRISEIRQKGDLPKSLRSYKIPFDDLATVADSTIRGRRDNRDTRPWVQVKNSLQRELLTDTFQSYDQVGNAFAMAGVRKGWSKVADRMDTTPEDIKTRLDAIIHRRNQIVHEGDITRASRPRKLKYNQVDREKIEEDITWLESIVESIEDVLV